MRLSPAYLFFKDLITGLLITLRTFFRKPVTVRYPHEKVQVFPSFRGRHAMVVDPETGKPRCVACLKCSVVCPSRCIKIEYEVDEKTGERRLKEYILEALRCVYCGYCEEVCPVGAIVLTEWFEYSGRCREDLIFNLEKLVQNWKEHIAKWDKEVYENKYWVLKGVPLKLKPAPRRMGLAVKIKGVKVDG